MGGADARVHGPDALDWSLCRTFIVVARRGSIAGAVGELGQSHPTIRRQLARLEAAIGATLFSRSQSGLIPTPLGLRLIPHVERMEAAASQVGRSAGWEDLAGTVRLVADELIGAALLPPILGRVRARHPGLVFELALSAMPLDLFRREADLALSTVRPAQQGVVASRVGSARLALHAGREWIDRNGAPDTVEELVAGRWLVGGPWTLRTAGLPSTAGKEPFAVWTESCTVTLSALSSGLGVGAIAMTAGGAHPDLVHVLPDVLLDQALWLSVHPDLRKVPQVRAIMDEIRVALSAP